MRLSIFLPASTLFSRAVAYMEIFNSLGRNVSQALASSLSDAESSNSMSYPVICSALFTFKMFCFRTGRKYS